METLIFHFSSNYDKKWNQQNVMQLILGLMLKKQYGVGGDCSRWEDKLDLSERHSSALALLKKFRPHVAKSVFEEEI